MQFITQLKLILLMLLVGAFGIISISFSYYIKDPSKPQDKFKSQPGSINSTTNQLTKSSDKTRYELINKPITDRNSFKSKILKIEDRFEKNYLLALFEKRNANFQDAFDLLFNLIELSPTYYQYYDDLVDMANITDNLENLKIQISERMNSTIQYSSYLAGLIDYKEGNYKDAIMKFEAILSENIASKEIYFWLAHFYRGTGNYKKALDILETADTIANEDDILKSKFTLAKGSLYYLSGDYENAEKYYLAGYEAAVAKGNSVEEIRGLANIAIILDETGDVEVARDKLKSAISKATIIENMEMLAFLYSELGVSFTYTNDIIQSRENYSESYKLYSILNNRERLSYLSSNIGSIYLQLANYKEALNYYQSGFKFAGQNKLGKFLNLIGIADVHANMANYSKALEYYHTARSLADSMKDISSKIKVDLGLGALFFNVNRPKSSLEYLYNAEKFVNPHELPYDATDIYYKIGTVEASLNNYVIANKYFDKGLELSNKTGDIYYNLVIKTEFAHALIQQHELEEAEKLLRDANKTSEHYELKQLVGLQELYMGMILKERNNYDKAINKFTAAFLISSEVSDYNNQIDAGYRIAQLYKETGKNKEAENWFIKTIDVIENISKPLLLNQDIQIAHFSGINDVYDSIIDFYLKQNKIKKAFDYIEKSRSRNTLQNLVNLRLINSGQKSDKINRYIDLQWMIGSKLYDEDEIKKLTAEMNNIKKDIGYENKYAVELLNKIPSSSVDSIQERLRDKEYIVSVFTAEDYSELFLISSKDFSAYKIDLSNTQLDELVRDITPLYKEDVNSKEMYVNQDLFSFNAESASKLYNSLFKNTLERIPQDATLIFSLPKELLTVPLEFLVTNWDDSQSSFYYADKIFLVEKYSISYTPSASIFVRLNDRIINQNKKILLVGDPDITNDEFVISYRSGMLKDSSLTSRNIELFPLEFSKEEIESIDKLVSDNVNLLSANATESNFKNQAPAGKIIHLSTHSFLYKDQPFIVLSQKEDLKNDGFLEMGEIVQMKLNADLVVLSSCRSGLGRIDKAEGVLGMQKSFFEAGANSVIVSLWDVDDKYTSIFMESFYKYLSEGKNKSEALREAKIHFIKDHSPNPYYWSAFILSGNNSDIQLSKKPNDLFYYILGVFILIAAGFILKQRYEQYLQLRQNINV